MKMRFAFRSWKQLQTLTEQFVMSSISNYTLSLALDRDPSRISWYVTDGFISRVLHQSNASAFDSYAPYQTIEQHFSLSDTGTYIFILMSATGRGIRCNTSFSCYNLTIQNSDDPLVKGSGNFSCLEQYYIGRSAARLQKPFFEGCRGILPYSIINTRTRQLYIIFGGIMGSLFMLLIVWRYTVRFLERKTEAADERRRQEELALDIELERKLKTARKESILCVLPKTLLPDSFHTCQLGEAMDETVFTRITGLEKSSCPICLDPFEPQEEICWSTHEECRHTFHADCVLKWLLRCEEQVCPMCRHPFL